MGLVIRVCGKWIVNGGLSVLIRLSLIVVSLTVQLWADVGGTVNKYEEYLSKLVSFEYQAEVENTADGERSVTRENVRRGGSDLWRLVQYGKGKDADTLPNVMEFSVHDGKGAIYRCQSGEFGKITSRIAPGPDDYSVPHLLRYPFMIGFVPLRESDQICYLPDYFREGKVAIEVSEDGLVSLRKTEGNLFVSLWLNTALGYAAVRVRVEQTLDKLEAGKTLLRDIEFQDFKSVSGVFVPGKCKEKVHNVGRTYELTSAGNSIEKIYVRKSELEHTFSKFKVGKTYTRKDFVFTSRIFEGTPAYMQDASHIDHVWFNGEIVPRTDENMLKIAMGDHKFMPGVDSYHFWFMLLGFLILAAGLTLKGIELYKKWHEDDGKKDERKENKRE